MLNLLKKLKNLEWVDANLSFHLNVKYGGAKAPLFYNIILMQNGKK